MLTYETIRKLIQDEKASKNLVELPEDFFDNVKIYLEKKSRLDRNKENAWEFENAKMEIERLLEIREQKILSLALNHVRTGTSPANMTPEEMGFFRKIVENLKEFRNLRKETLEGKPEKRIVLALLEDMPEFVGANMKTYGPFRKGDVVTLPEENASLLLEKGMAKRIETGEEKQL